MNRFLAVLQMGLALILAAIALMTLVNMVFIALRPETISVVNSIIGQTLLIICFLALARLLLKKGWARFSMPDRQDRSAAGQDDQSQA